VFGAGSSELEPRCRPSASALRCWSGGIRFTVGARLATSTPGSRRVGCGLEGSFCGPDLLIRSQSRSGEGPKASSRRGRASGWGPRTARSEGRFPSSLGSMSSPRTTGRLTGWLRFGGADYVLAPAHGGEGFAPRADVSVVLGRFVAKPVDQRGAHVGGNIGVPRGT
jgi:hypothetical protein